MDWMVDAFVGDSTITKVVEGAALAKKRAGRRKVRARWTRSKGGGRKSGTYVPVIGE